MTTHPAETPDEQHSVRMAWTASSVRGASGRNGHDVEGGGAVQAMHDVDADAAAPEVRALRQTVREQMQHIDELNAHVELLIGRQRELRMLLLETHDQLIKRDEALGRAQTGLPPKEPRAEIERIRRHAVIQVQQRDAEIERLRLEAVELRASVKRERERLRAFKSTRYWRFRLWLKDLFRRP